MLVYQRVVETCGFSNMPWCHVQVPEVPPEVPGVQEVTALHALQRVGDILDGPAPNWTAIHGNPWGFHGNMKGTSIFS